MTNVVLTSACQIDPDSGSTLDPVTTTEPIPTSTIESSNENPLEFVEQTNTDGNFQAKIDVNYQAHDVALETAKTNEHERTNGLKLDKYHQMEIDDGYNEHPDKMKICCSMLNRLFLGLAIVCFALFLCSIAFIVANMKGVSLFKTLLFCLFEIEEKKIRYSIYMNKMRLMHEAIIFVYIVNTNAISMTNTVCN